MVPKGFAIFEMDVTSKGLSWIDQMYQKFEAICVEVDQNSSILLQETTKYVENQVAVVGTNVRKICEEVIQDILPPGPDTAIKSIASDISLDFVEEFELFEKPKSNTKKVHALNLESEAYPKLEQNNVSSESLSSDISNDFIEEFELFEKSNLNQKKSDTLNVESVVSPKLEQNYVSSEQDLVCAFPVPDKLQKDHPVLPEEKPSEFPALDILGQTPCLSVEDLSAPEDLSLINEAQKQSLQLQLEANACVDLPQGALLKSPADKTGAELYQDDQKNEDICAVAEMQVNDHPIHKDGIDEIIRESGVHCMEETGNCEENVEVHEEDRETFFSIIESFIPDPANLSEEESLHELLAAQQDEKEESAYWYENEDVQKPYMIDISTPNLLDMNAEKWQHVENCDSEWEFL